MKVSLTKSQLELKQLIEEKLSILHEHYSDSKRLRESELQSTYRIMADAAHELHMQLDPKPKHKQQTIENSGLNPEDPEFYYHTHPTEDLLAYLEDDSSNNDPEDSTLGKTFDFKVYTKRWGHKDNYIIKRNTDGWLVKFNAYEIQGGNDGSPAFEKVLAHDSISYPSDLGSYLSSIWNRAKDQGLSEVEVQDMLNEIATWISDMEGKSPKHLLD